MQKRTLVVLVTILAAACGGGSPSSPTAPTPSNPPAPASSFNGTWSGANSSGTIGLRSLEFVVQNNIVTAFTLTYQLAPGFAANVWSATVNAPVSGSAFSFGFRSTSSIGNNLCTTITGTFSSGTAGRVDTSQLFFDGTPPQCSPAFGFAAATGLAVNRQ